MFGGFGVSEFTGLGLWGFGFEGFWVQSEVRDVEGTQTLLKSPITKL